MASPISARAARSFASALAVRSWVSACAASGLACSVGQLALRQLEQVVHRAARDPQSHA